MTTKEVVKLENGLTVIHVSRPGTKTFYASLAYGTGSFHDPPELLGATHFCEHLAFRGSSVELWHELRELGVHVNAQTACDHTRFYLAGHVDHLQKAICFLKSVLTNESCSEEAFLAEKKIFHHEMVESVDCSARESSSGTHSRMLLGDPNWKSDGDTQIESLKAFKLEQLESFRQEVFANAKVALAIATPWESELALSIIKDDLGKQIQRELRSEYTAYPRARNQRQLTLASDPWAYVWIHLTHTLPQYDYLTRLTAWILGRLLGGLIFQELRHEQSLAYNATSTDLPYLQLTAIRSFVSVPRSSVMRALDQTLSYHDRLACEGISAVQLSSAKQLLVQWHEMEMESPGQLVEFLAYEALRGGDQVHLSSETYLQKTSTLQLDEVNAAAASMLDPRNRYLFVGGRMGWLLRRQVRHRFRESRNT